MSNKIGFFMINFRVKSLQVNYPFEIKKIDEQKSFFCSKHEKFFWVFY